MNTIDKLPCLIARRHLYEVWGISEHEYRKLVGSGVLVPIQVPGTRYRKFSKSDVIQILGTPGGHHANRT